MAENITPEMFDVFGGTGEILLHGKGVGEREYIVDTTLPMHPLFRRILDAVDRVLESFAWEEMADAPNP